MMASNRYYNNEKWTGFQTNVYISNINSNSGNSGNGRGRGNGRGNGRSGKCSGRDSGRCIVSGSSRGSGSRCGGDRGSGSGGIDNKDSGGVVKYNLLSSICNDEVMVVIVVAVVLKHTL